MQALLTNIHKILNGVVPVIITLGVVYFVWGVVQYVIGGGEEAKKKGKDRIIYGIIGLVVIISLWGLVNILINTFGLGGASAPGLAAGSTSACNLVTSGTGFNFARLVDYITCLIGRSVIPLIFALAVAAFVWGVIKFFILNADEEAKRSQGKQFMIWGLIALAVMLCVWGLVSVLGGTFGVNTSVIPQTKQ